MRFDRYKRQMDEMQRAFNQTQTRLKEMSTLVEENDLKHAQALEKEKEKTRQLSAEVSKSNLSYFLYYAEACYEFAGPISASLRPGNTALFEEISHRI